MHTAIREACQLGDLLLRPQPQLELLGAQAQAEERRRVYCSTLTKTDRGLGPSNSHRKIAW
jgi:hypothetical protein